MYTKWIALIGVTLVVTFVGWCSYDYGYTSAENQSMQSYEDTIRSLQANVRRVLERERDAYKKQEQIESKYLEKIEEMKQNETHVINEYRADNLSLRDSLKVKQCPDVSITTNSTSSDHATTTGGLYDRDVEFLIRLATRADAIAEQLKSAQALIQQDRELCNGQIDQSLHHQKIVSQGTSEGAPQAGAKTSQVFISA
ncbi:hypothetical protein EXE10_18250 [Acinetobacter sp. WCHAc060033]|uniref:lysis system i-spanin subunit Rz n=1 Tax=Acinetobacter sp. WCHAc060033 TaxID=2518624 RepID=UPI00102343F3|nr:lysis system i-spanin subunit Rz [Acinetobacter sp. WCHAc060033]RZG78362.1 hypothetical protein EXE10_18250 [Acinetobacter sp. WCHAc060033]